MRVITGIARGRKLMEPEGLDIRPTTDNVKESIFNIIQFDIEGRKVLDLFAGTGQLGIEALSRGAENCVFVDQSKAAVKLVKDNLKKTQLENGRVVQGDSISFLAGREKFDLIFLDPPYATTLLENSLQNIVKFDKLNTGGIIVCESSADIELPELEAPYQRLKTYRYGKVKITVYTRL